MRFGRRSENYLRTAHRDLQRVMRRALSFGIIDFAVIDGHRGEAQQNEYFRTGRSKIQWPNGRHNTFPADAVDVVPWINGTDNWVEDVYWGQLYGVIMAAAAIEGVKLRWGGDWDMDGDITDQTFNDLGHFEIRRN